MAECLESFQRYLLQEDKSNPLGNALETSFKLGAF